MTYIDHLLTLTPRVYVWREDGPDLTEAEVEALEYEKAVVVCRSCGERWHPDSSETNAQWADFHSRCDEAPCDHCGELTNTPDACFTCYHEPFGIGWQQDRAEASAYGSGIFG